MRTLPLIVLLVASFAGAAAPARAVAPALAWPVRGPVAERFALSAAAPYVPGQHRGIDVAAPAGTPVRAVCAGRVRFAGSAGSFGRAVTVACGGWIVSYGHLSVIATAAGAAVARGERIGRVGTTGHGSTPGPHLHLGVRRAGAPHGYVDPLALLPATRPPSPPPVAPPRGPARRSPPASARRHRERPRPERPGPERLPNRIPSPAAAATATPSPAAVPDPPPARVPASVWLGLGLLAAGVPSLALVRAGGGRGERRRRHQRVAIRNSAR